MKVLVVGGTGTVGSAVTASLLARGLQPRVLTRSADRAARLPGGAEAAIGALETPRTLPAAFDGVGAAFLLVPMSPTETEQGLAGVEAAEAAGIGRLVYLSVAMPAGSENVPHVASKIPVEAAVRSSGIPWTILHPNNFFQNDIWLRDAIVNRGVYPHPLGSRGLNRVDVRDIAEAAAAALAGNVNGVFPMNGPRGMTGEDTARVYSEQLGRPVRYCGDDLEAWEREAATTLPGWLVHDLRLMFEYFIQNGVHASGRDFAAQEQLLGHAPRPFEAFVAELVRAWRSA